MKNSLFPNRRKLLSPLIVSSQSMNSALHNNQPELRILILPAPLQMLVYCDSLFNQMVKILRNFRSKPYQTWRIRTNERISNERRKYKSTTNKQIPRREHRKRNIRTMSLEPLFANLQIRSSAWTLRKKKNRRKKFVQGSLNHPQHQYREDEGKGRLE